MYDRIKNNESNESDKPSKSLYERYLEEKGDLKQAPKDTVPKLKKEFDCATTYEYYTKLRESKKEWEAKNATNC